MPSRKKKRKKYLSRLLFCMLVSLTVCCAFFPMLKPCSQMWKNIKTSNFSIFWILLQKRVYFISNESNSNWTPQNFWYWLGIRLRFYWIKILLQPGNSLWNRPSLYLVPFLVIVTEFEMFGDYFLTGKFASNWRC